MSEKYNGWTNYSTWLAYTWITNDYASYKHYTAKAKQAKSISDFSQLLENDFIQKAYSLTGESGFYCDLMQNALNKIDFHEIAEALSDETN